MEVNNTDYPLKVKRSVDDLEKSYSSDEEFLQYYQYIVREYLVKTDTRGILIYHSTGVGKSITASSIADYYRKYDPKRKIIILLPKSLQSNFQNNVKKYMRNNPHNSHVEKSKNFIDTTVEHKYNFISLNASNVFTQLSRLNKAEHEEELDKKLGVFTEHVKGFLENSLLIIDEFHNLSNAITNGSKNAVQLYNTIMNTRNIKLAFLTGTPIINNPFELVPTFNLLKGYMYEKKRKITIFPENRDEFSKFFLKDYKEIKNKEKFQNRIFGLVSYYGDYYFDKENRKDFPQQKPTIIEKVPMSLYQFGRYQEAREIELKEEANKMKKTNKSEFFTAKDKSKSSSSYRIRSRQVSNYFIPEYALVFRNSRTSVVKHINKIKETDLLDLDKHSPKFKKIIENFAQFPNQLGVVYSEFVSGEGLALFSMVLEKQGWVYWEKSKNFIDRNEEFQLSNSSDKTEESETKGGSKVRTYALITGDIPMMERQNIINVFNAKENTTGKDISLLLISKSGAEGLNLYRVRHIHIMEPFWNYARIEQIIARGVRYLSHTDMPKKDQNVQPFIYLSTYPKSYDKKNKENTTDEEIYGSAVNGKKLRDEFALAIVEASIDCSVNRSKIPKNLQDKLTCRLCAPTNEQLYETDLYKELDKPNPCKTLSDKKEVKAKEIIVSLDGNERKFYYTESDGEIKIFDYSEDLGGYVPVKRSYPFYGDIIKKIMKFE
jgi:superfamily II DNA or RNA helicase